MLFDFLNLFFSPDDAGGAGDKPADDKPADDKPADDKGGTDDVEAKIQKARDEERAAVKRERLEKNKHFYSRNPEEFEELKKIMGENGGDPEARKHVRELELRLARERALRKFGLDDDDEDLIAADSEEAIYAKAKRLSEKIEAKKSANADGKDADGEAKKSGDAETKKTADPDKDLPVYKSADEANAAAMKTWKEIRDK